MKAIVCEKYGPPEVLKLTDVPKPVPADNEVLVKTYATTVSVADIRIRSFNIPLKKLLWLPARIALGFTRPKNSILGMEMAGVVEEVGKTVKNFSPGDRVFAATLDRFGAYAEYRCIPEAGPIAVIPGNLTMQEAAAIPIGARTALFYLRKANIQPGQQILIHGASGSVGSYAVQLAKQFGANVTGVCSTANVELVQSLGADRVIDYTAGDFADGTRYDVIFDAVNKAPVSKCLSSLKKGGYYMNATTPLPSAGMIKAKLLNNITLVLAQSCPETSEALNFIGGLIEQGKIKVVIDRRYSFSLEQVIEAHRYVDQGHKKGNVVISLAPADPGPGH